MNTKFSLLERRFSNKPIVFCKLFFVIVFIHFGKSIFGQNMLSPYLQFNLPLSDVAVDEIIFPLDDLQTQGIKSAKCIATSINLDNLQQVDTIESYSFKFDRRCRVIQSSYQNLQSKIKMICNILYSADNTLKECLFYDERDSLQSILTYHYLNKNLISVDEKKVYLYTNKLVNKTSDILIYGDGLLKKKISYWYNPLDQSLIDSVLYGYNYDTLGRLVEYIVTPSPTFSKNIPNTFLQEGVISEKENILYSADSYVSSKYNIYDKTPLGPVLISRDTIRNIKISNNDFFILEIKNKISVGYQFSMVDSNQMLEYRYGEIKRTDYYNNTKLPKSITINDGKKLLVFYFVYDG